MGNIFNDNDRFNDDGLKTESGDSISSDEFLSDLDSEDAEFMEVFFDKTLDETSSEAEYLVRGAKLRCDCGSHTRMLNLPLCHGVYHLGHPVIHQKDAKVGDDQNITTFGVCSSSSNPEEKWFGDNITLVSEDNPDENVKGAPCVPIIVDNEWKNPKWDTFIADNENLDGSDEFINPNDRVYFPATTTESFLVCKYCGLIEPQTSGQENVPEVEEESETENIAP